ncbi:MAG: hypothetical protein ACXAC5_02240 [Promethearchaeota archaeon]|jgi:hypothetical protein
MTTTSTTQWQDLNDVFAEGSLEIWYMRPEHFRTGITGGKPDRNDLETTHIKLGTIAPCPKGSYSVDELDEVWKKLQGEFWSPNGEAKTMIRTAGLMHTSMSVGDCFRFANGEVWVVAMTGFEVVQ